MGDAVELIADGMIDRRVGVAVDIRPDRGIAIQVATPLAVLEHGAFASNENEWVVVRFAPVAHRREGMPEVCFVERLQLRRIPNISHRQELWPIKRAA
jgi:hypothetical protein